MAAASYSPANDLTRAFFPSLRKFMIPTWDVEAVEEDEPLQAKTEVGGVTKASADEPDVEATIAMAIAMVDAMRRQEDFVVGADDSLMVNRVNLKGRL